MSAKKAATAVIRAAEKYPDPHESPIPPHSQIVAAVVNL